jgi:hypothetical protein
MINTINELKRKIAEKNFVLDSLNNKHIKDKTEMESVKKELDKLLYLYYKSLSSKNGIVNSKFH